MSTALKQIEEHEKAIEQIRANAFTQDIIDVLQNKKHTEEELYTVCKAFTGNVERKMRQANLVKARASRKGNPAPKTE